MSEWTRIYARYGQRWECVVTFRSYHDAVRYMDAIKDNPGLAKFDDNGKPYYYLRDGRFSDSPHPSRLWPARWRLNHAPSTL